MLTSHRETKNIPLVAVTGLAHEQEQKQIFVVSFNDYICKPYILEDLRRAIAVNFRENLYVRFLTVRMPIMAKGYTFTLATFFFRQAY